MSCCIQTCFFYSLEPPGVPERLWASASTGSNDIGIRKGKSERRKRKVKKTLFSMQHRAEVYKHRETKESGEEGPARV